MKILKPPALKKGDVIGICAPASAIEHTDQLHRGVRYLEQLGYRVEPGKNILRRRGYLAGTDRQRADDLNDLFSNKQVKAIFAARVQKASLAAIRFLSATGGSSVVSGRVFNL